MHKILIVDDDPHIREVVRFALEQDGYSISEAENGLDALRLYESEKPDLLVLDIMMPELDGTEVCRQLQRTANTPIVFLSARDDELDRILGLELGGDDYITKPFSPRELVARVRAVLRRVQSVTESGDEQTGEWHHGGLRLDQNQFKVWYDEQEIILTVTEFGILRTLIRKPGQVFTRDNLMQQAYETTTVVSDRTIDSHVRRLRSKLRNAGIDPVITVHGLGYKLDSNCQ